MNPVHGNAKKVGYAPVNGLKMYYEIAGAGDPLVYIPPAFGCAGMKSFPELIANHSLITMDLQGHGRTADMPERPMTLEQNAEDVVSLLKHLGHFALFSEPERVVPVIANFLKATGRDIPVATAETGYQPGETR